MYLLRKQGGPMLWRESRTSGGTGRAMSRKSTKRWRASGPTVLGFAAVFSCSCALFVLTDSQPVGGNNSIQMVNGGSVQSRLNLYGSGNGPQKSKESGKKAVVDNSRSSGLGTSTKREGEELKAIPLPHLPTSGHSTSTSIRVAGGTDQAPPAAAAPSVSPEESGRSEANRSDLSKTISVDVKVAAVIAHARTLTRQGLVEEASRELELAWFNTRHICPEGVAPEVLAGGDSQAIVKDPTLASDGASSIIPAKPYWKVSLLEAMCANFAMMAKGAELCRAYYEDVGETCRADEGIGGASGDRITAEEGNTMGWFTQRYASPTLVCLVGRSLIELNRTEDAVSMWQTLLRSRRARDSSHPSQLACAASGLALTLGAHGRWSEAEEGKAVLRQLLTRAVESYGEADGEADKAIVIPSVMRYLDGVNEVDLAKYASHHATVASKGFGDEDMSSGIRTKPQRTSKLRIGYIVANLGKYTHPMKETVGSIARNHNPMTTTVYILSLSPFTSGPEAGFPDLPKHVTYVNIGLVGSGGADAGRVRALAVAQLELHILVDTIGFTEDISPGLAVLSHRPSPIQVRLHGDAGIVGLPFVDYVVADPSVFSVREFGELQKTRREGDIQDGLQQNNFERLALLPAWLPSTDVSQHTVVRGYTRETFGIPEDAVVYVSFSRVLKIDRQTWQTWMTILKRVPGSVLWLMKAPEAEWYLQNAAESEGVEPSRLIFCCQTVDLSGVLEKLRLADIYLDPMMYGGVSTLSEALAANVPPVVLDSYPSTSAGALSPPSVSSTWTKRAGPHVLKQIGVGQRCIAPSATHYEEMAVRLGTDVTERQELQSFLVEMQSRHWWFRKGSYAFFLEHLYTEMWARHRERMQPDDITTLADIFTTDGDWDRIGVEPTLQRPVESAPRDEL